MILTTIFQSLKNRSNRSNPPPSARGCSELTRGEPVKLVLTKKLMRKPVEQVPNKNPEIVSK